MGGENAGSSTLQKGICAFKKHMLETTQPPHPPLVKKLNRAMSQIKTLQRSLEDRGVQWKHEQQTPTEGPHFVSGLQFGFHEIAFNNNNIKHHLESRVNIERKASA